MKEEYIVRRKTQNLKRKLITYTEKMFQDITHVLEENQTVNEFIRIAIAEKLERMGEDI